MLGWLGLAAAGCQLDGETGTSPSALQAAVVPGADFVMRVDYRRMTESAVLENLATAEADQTPGPTAPNDRWAKFIETTGLGAESLREILVSMDLDSIDLASGASRDERMENAEAVLGVSLDTPLTLEDIVAGVEAADADGGDAAAAIEETDDGQRLVRIEAQEENQTRIVYAATSSGGDTVYFSMNVTSVRRALDRERSGTPEPIPPSLETVETALSPEAQVRLTLLAPPSWRAKIRDQVDDPSPSGGLAAGMLAPLKDLQSLALGMAFDADVKVELVGDLGNEEAAQQASAFLQMMVLPMIRSALAERAGSGDADSLRVGVEGTVLQLGLSLTEADIVAFREKASSMSPQAGLGGGSN